MSGLKRELDGLAAESAFSGVVRVDRDRVEVAKAYGLAHRGLEIPNTVDTRFRDRERHEGPDPLAVVSLVEDGLLEPSTTRVRCSAAICRSSTTA